MTRLRRGRLATAMLLGGSTIIGAGAPVAAPLATAAAAAATAGSTVSAVTASACPQPFPSTNVWNKQILTLPVRTDSKKLLTTMGLTKTLHADFGTNAGYGIPYNVVSAATPLSTVTFTWPDESDNVGYPIPASPKIEGNGAGGDRHLLMVDPTACRLWELYAADHSTGTWRAGSGATWDLTSNALRPDGWTSADAAGLPIDPGLVTYDEITSGQINHAIRFTVPRTRDHHIYPARHDAGSGTSSSLPSMGMRLRLKASVNISSFPYETRVILNALKRYGMILADNGSAYYLSGVSDPRLNDDDLHALSRITGSMFDVVNTTGFVNG